jgi:hypothetical protein
MATQKNACKVITAGFPNHNGSLGPGLHSSSVFRAVNKGKTSVNSAGIGQGAPVLVEVGDV